MLKKIILKYVKTVVGKQISFHIAALCCATQTILPKPKENNFHTAVGNQLSSISGIWHTAVFYLVMFYMFIHNGAACQQPRPITAAMAELRVGRFLLEQHTK